MENGPLTVIINDEYRIIIDAPNRVEFTSFEERFSQCLKWSNIFGLILEVVKFIGPG